MPGDYEKRMLRVLEHIHSHPDGDLSLDRLADVAAMSRFHWHRVFHAMTGETCAQAVRRIRLHRAACWLVRTDWPVERIAARVGYPSVQSFGRAFRQAYGMPPARFRDSGAIGAPQLQSNQGEFPMYDVTIETEPPRELAVLAHQGPYHEIGKAFEKLSAIAAARGLWPHVTTIVGVYLDDPGAVPPADLRALAGLELRPGTDRPADLEAFRLAGGRVARLRYTGPYSGLQGAYDYLYGKWLPESGEEPAEAPCYEINRNTPATAAPAELVTDIFLPLTARR